EYMEEFYIPNNIVISIAGNVEKDFIEKVEKHFASFPRPNRDIIQEKPLFVYDSITNEKEIEQEHDCFCLPVLAAKDEAAVSLAMINSTLGVSMSSRLFQEVREKRGLAYSVYSFHNAYVDSGMLGIYAGTTKEQLPVLREAVDETIARLVEDSLTDKELLNKKEKLKGNS